MNGPIDIHAGRWIKGEPNANATKWAGKKVRYHLADGRKVFVDMTVAQWTCPCCLARELRAIADTLDPDDDFSGGFN